MYSPTLGRWMQMDPAGYVDGLNPYQEVRSNPETGVDPTGLSTEFPGINVGGPKHNATDLSDFRRFVQTYSQTAGVARDYIFDHQWGGTVPVIRWDEVAAEQNEMAKQDECGWTVTRTYNFIGTVKSRADHLTISDDTLQWLHDNRVDICGLTWLVDSFNELAVAHEMLHVNNFLSTFKTIEAVGTGIDKAAAEAAAKEDYDCQRNAMIYQFRAIEHDIDENGDRATGMELLLSIYDMLPPRPDEQPIPYNPELPGVA